MGYYVYMLSCRREGDQKFYTGQTNDLQRRVREHKRYAEQNKRRKYTGRFDEIELVWFKEVDTRKEAEAEERRIKRFSRARKAKLIQRHTG